MRLIAAATADVTLHGPVEIIPSPPAPQHLWRAAALQLNRYELSCATGNVWGKIVVADTPRKYSPAALFGGPVLAVVAYVLGYFLAGLLIRLGLFFIADVALVSFLINLVAAIIGMWVARRACDVVFKNYSGRGIFVVILCLELVSATLELARVTNAQTTPAELIGGLVAVGAAYFWFWRRDSSSIAAEAETSTERKGLHRVWEPFVPFLAVAPQVLFGVVGLVQLWAVSAQLHAFAHIPNFFSFVAALFVTYIPVVGSVIGFFGAKDAWGWPAWQAALLCFGPFGLVVAFSLLSTAVSAAANALPSRPRPKLAELP